MGIFEKSGTETLWCCFNYQTVYILIWCKALITELALHSGNKKKQVCREFMMFVRKKIIPCSKTVCCKSCASARHLQEIFKGVVHD